MQFGPLKINTTQWPEDPATQKDKAASEKALASKAARLVRKLITSHDWITHEHGSGVTGYSLSCEFHIVTGAEVQRMIQSAVEAALRDERQQIIERIERRGV